MNPIIALTLITAALIGAPTAAQSIDDCNVVWTTPSRDAAGSMPIGNGELGLNVWVEDGGDLLFYLARTDSWSETDRLLKLGQVRLSLTPNPFVNGAPFRQELRLREGRIDISAGPTSQPFELSILVDADSPTVSISGESTLPVTIVAALESWRTKAHRLIDPDELRSSWTMHSSPTEVAVSESADVVLERDAPATRNAVIWYHRNEESVVPLTVRHQGLTEIADKIRDPLLHRTFGGRMEGHAFLRTAPTRLMLEGVRNFSLSVTTHCAQTPTAQAWIEQIDAMAAGAPAFDEARIRTAKWWRSFWDRSWIFVNGPGVPASTDESGSAASRISQAYALQRWMIACAGRGAFPPKFNGSIFTVEPRHTEKQTWNADWRKWGGCYWWQNTRLPYYPMLAAGDFDLMQPLFQFYESVGPACAARARLYYDAEGVYFPETMTTFGTYSNGDYGWKRDGHERSEVLCPWWQWAWQQNLELTQLMLDCAAYSGDKEFLTKRALPMACETLRYYDSRFRRDAAGKIVISPTQAAETYWNKVVNDAPTVGGLHAVCDQLLALPETVGTADERAFWRRMKDATPPLPLRSVDGVKVAAPAETYEDKRSNCETPELYPLWPFRQYGIGKSNIEAAIEAYRRRTDKSHVGWTQDGMFAAMLGLTDEAKADLLAKCANSHKNHRFPAMWGPNFDWLPDQCHGSNLMNVLQLMLLQADGDRILLLPAWPRDWDVSFKLRAPRQTTVECEFRGGKIQRLAVMPESRRADVRIMTE